MRDGRKRQRLQVFQCCVESKHGPRAWHFIIFSAIQNAIFSSPPLNMSLRCTKLESNSLVLDTLSLWVQARLSLFYLFTDWPFIYLCFYLFTFNSIIEKPPPITKTRTLMLTYIYPLILSLVHISLFHFYKELWHL